MAGVSLTLRNLLGSRSYFAQATGFLYAGLAMTGPWLLTSLFMQLLNAADLPGLDPSARQAFQGLVLYGYCGSMILTGLIQLVLARHVSDRLYVGDWSGVTPSYAAGTLLSLVLHGAVVLAYVAVRRPEPALAAAEVAFFESLALAWTGMIFLGVLRNFLLIAAAFGAGMAASFAAALLLAPREGLPGLLWAFAAGHALIAAILGAGLRAEHPAGRAFDFGFFRTMGRHPSLLWIGLGYAGAVWADKIVFWAAPEALRSRAGLPCFPIYDNTAFLSYLTVIPALALVFIRLEVSFHDKYRNFYAAIREGADLGAIRACRRHVVDSFRITLDRIVAIQGPVTLLALLLAPRLLSWAGMDWVHYYTFRFMCVAALLQVLAMATMLAAIHLAFYRVAMGIVAAQLVAGAVGTWLSLQAGPEYYGTGAVAGGLAGLAVGYPLVSRALGNLEGRTFMAQ
jgi:uncharacterized membrane protein